MTVLSKVLGKRHESLQFLLSHPAYAKHPLRAWFKVLSWYVLVSLRQSPVKRVHEWGLNVTLPTLFKTPAKVFYVFGREYDETLSFLDSILPTEGGFLDVGANFGIYSLLAAKKMPTLEIHAFDPLPDMCDLLTENAKKIGLPNLHIHQVGLSENSGKATLNVHPDNGRSSLRTLKQDTSGTLEIEVTTLDKSLKETLMVSVMKLDVEGYECKVLRGARGLLEKQHPLILFENNPGALRESGDSPEELYTLLKDSGYQIYSETGEQTLSPVQPKEFGNFIAIHPTNKTILPEGWTFEERAAQAPMS